MHRPSPWYGHKLNRSLNCSHASSSDSSSLWAKAVIWVLRLAILRGGKNFIRKILVSSSHVVMHPGGKEWSHALTMSLSEKGNSHNRIALAETPLSFKIPHTSQNTERCKLASSNMVLPNWNYYTMEIRADLSSKLLASTFDWAMLEVTS